MIKLSFLDFICEVSLDLFGSEREMLAVIHNTSLEEVNLGNIQEENFTWLEFYEVENFIMQLHEKEDKFQSAYMCDGKIVCQFDEKFVIDLV